MSTIMTLASGTFGEAMRRKILNVFLFVAIGLMIMFFAFAQFNSDQQIEIITSFGHGIITLAGVFISVILGINLVPNEIEKRTIYTILSKPVQRYQFLVGKFLGGLATVAVNIVLMGVLFYAVVELKDHASGHLHLEILQGILMIFFEMMLINALALMFSVFTTPFVNFFLTFSVYILGSMSSITEAMAEPSDKKNPFITNVFSVVHFLIPNFGNYDIQNKIIHPEIFIKNMTLYIAQNGIYAIIYSLIMLLIAILIFDRREV